VETAQPHSAESSTRMLTPLAPLLDRIAAFPPLARCETVPLACATGRVLAEDVIAAGAVPPQPIARRTGVAVRAEETLGASPYAPATLSVAVPVAAGEVVPGRCDAVLPGEAVERFGGAAVASETVAQGEGVMRAGGEIAEGATVLRRGRLLGAVDLGVARAAGRTHLAVLALPRVEIRLAEPAATMLRACIAAPGEEGAADLVVSPADGVPRLAARPIEDAALDLDATPPRLCLPEGAAAWLGWLALGEALLRRLSGLPAHGTIRLRLTRRIASAVGLADLVLVRIRGEEAEPLASADAPSLALLAEADGMVMLPPESEGLPAGAIVAVQRFRA
jgi:molybdopterin molybdotransferase